MAEGLQQKQGGVAQKKTGTGFQKKESEFLFEGLVPPKQNLGEGRGSKKISQRVAKKWETTFFFGGGSEKS